MTYSYASIQTFIFGLGNGLPPIRHLTKCSIKTCFFIIQLFLFKNVFRYYGLWNHSCWYQPKPFFLFRKVTFCQCFQFKNRILKYIHCVGVLAALLHYPPCYHFHGSNCLTVVCGWPSMILICIWYGCSQWAIYHGCSNVQERQIWADLRNN